MFDHVIAVDWSADATRGPAKPAESKCWLAAGSKEKRSEPEYFRTRADCRERIRELAAGCPGRVLIGFDFAFGYPLTAEGRQLMPSGRGLCALLGWMIDDNDDNSNNRFLVGDHLNRRIMERTGWGEGPFWGRPGHLELPDLPVTRPTKCPMPEYRQIEQTLRASSKQPQSVWKLSYAGSVGSQSLLGLASVDRLLRDPEIGPRCRLWPFESTSGPETIVIGEIWPGVLPSDGHDHPIKDARQVVTIRDAILNQPEKWTAFPEAHRAEGWIMGVEP